MTPPQNPPYTALRNGRLTMPTTSQSQDQPPLSNAQRQARYRARQKLQQQAPVTRYRRPTDRRSRLRRLNDAIAELLTLQAEYATWFDALPDGLRDSPTATVLQAIIDFDLEELADIVPPRGYGRD